MGDDEQRLIEEARRSREETEKLRKEAAEEADDEAVNPVAETSSGDADSVTEDD
jgi:hypothetical protein